MLAPAPALPFAAAAALSTQDLGHPPLPHSGSRRLPPSSSFSSFTHSLSILPKFDRQTEVPGEPRGGRKNKTESTGEETRTTFMTISLSLSHQMHTQHSASLKWPTTFSPHDPDHVLYSLLLLLQFSVICRLATLVHQGSVFRFPSCLLHFFPVLASPSFTDSNPSSVHIKVSSRCLPSIFAVVAGPAPRHAAPPSPQCASVCAPICGRATEGEIERGREEVGRGARWRGESRGARASTRRTERPSCEERMNI